MEEYLGKFARDLDETIAAGTRRSRQQQRQYMQQHAPAREEPALVLDDQALGALTRPPHPSTLPRDGIENPLATHDEGIVLQRLLSHPNKREVFVSNILGLMGNVFARDQEQRRQQLRLLCGRFVQNDEWALRERESLGQLLQSFESDWMAFMRAKELPPSINLARMLCHEAAAHCDQFSAAWILRLESPSTASLVDPSVRHYFQTIVAQKCRQRADELRQSRNALVENIIRCPLPLFFPPQVTIESILQAVAGKEADAGTSSNLAVQRYDNPPTGSDEDCLIFKEINPGRRQTPQPPGFNQAVGSPGIFCINAAPPFLTPAPALHELPEVPLSHLPCNRPIGEHLAPINGKGTGTGGGGRGARKHGTAVASKKSTDFIRRHLLAGVSHSSGSLSVSRQSVTGNRGIPPPQMEASHAAAYVPIGPAPPPSRLPSTAFMGVVPGVCHL